MLKLLLAAVAGGTSYYASRGSKSPRRAVATREQRGVLQSMDRRDPGHPQKVLKREMILSGSALTVAVTSALSGGSFGVLVVPLLMPQRLGYFREGYRMLREQGRFGMALSDCLVFVALIGLGRWVALAVIAILLTVAKLLVMRTEDHSHRHITDLFATGTTTVWVWRDGVEVELPFAELAQGDIVVVRAGEVIPADGDVVAGAGSVDQCLLTGEAQPVERQVGDTVLATSTLLTGQLRFCVQRSGSDTTAGRIATALEQSSDYRLELQWRWSERLDAIAPACLGAGVAAFTLAGVMPGLLTLMSLTGLGYGMRLVAPLQLCSFLRATSESLILVKDGRVFEQLQDIDTVVFDKTGTLTQEQPHVEQIHSFAGLDANTVLSLAATAEQRQTHPIARAILAEAARCGVTVSLPQDGRYDLGLGIAAHLDDGRLVRVGSTRYLQALSLELSDTQQRLEADNHARGGNLVWVVLDDVLIGGIEVLPTLRPESAEVVRQLQSMGLHCAVLSGDRQAPTRYLAEQLALDEWFAEVLPDGKATVIERLQQQGRRVCYVGDGINDSLALKQANVSVSLTGASSIAVDTAQVLMTDRGLSRLPLLLRSGQVFQQAMRRNYLITSAPNILVFSGVLMGTVGLGTIVGVYYASMAAGAVHALGTPQLTADTA